MNQQQEQTDELLKEIDRNIQELKKAERALVQHNRQTLRTIAQMRRHVLELEKILSKR